MLTRAYGSTGIHVSVLGFGGMRFREAEDPDVSASLVKAAYDAGVTYFDTAPGYGRSEEIFGRAFRGMRRTRRERPFYVATKSLKADPADIRRDLETSLSRMGLDAVDFFHVWCLMRPADFDQRRARGALREFERLRDEGLARHICVSAHMTGPEIARLLADYPFAGVLLGYSAMNFAYREEGVEAAARLGRGVVVMNPLGGGLIPQHPERFGFVRTRSGETVVEGALRFLAGDPRITCVLVGLSKEAELREAVGAIEGCGTLTDERRAAIRAGLREAFDRLCTVCGYCRPCPEGLEVPQLMDAYNQFVLGGEPEAIGARLRWHWGRDTARMDELARCTECGTCESRCTQRLPVVQRIREIRAALEKASGAAG